MTKKDGVVNILKPAAMTSHDVVAKVRKIYQTKKVGHTGTLDPDAVGVLPICVGQATRLVEYLTDKDKRYRVLLKFGQETDTQDGTGQVIKETETCSLEREAFAQLLEGFIGEIEQVPPMYSAIKKDGQPLYKLARQGISVERAPRLVKIYAIKLLMYNKESAMLEVHCGKGTYIRTLCQDIGRAAGSSAYMQYLLRIQSGPFKLEESVTLEHLEQMERPEEALISLNEALPGMQAIVLADTEEQKALANGMTIKARTLINDGQICKASHPDGTLLAIGRLQGGYFKPDKVFKAGE